MARPSLVNNFDTLLAAGFPFGSGSVQLQPGDGVLITNRLFGAGFPVISVAAPLRFSVISQDAFDASGLLVDDSKLAIYEATVLTGDILSGVTVVEGTTDQDFATGDMFACNMTGGVISKIYQAFDAGLQATGKVGGQTLIGGTAAGNALTLQGSSDPANGPVSILIPSQVVPGTYVTTGWDALGNYTNTRPTNQTTTGATFRQSAIFLQDGSLPANGTNTGADTQGTSLWMASQFVYNGSSDTTVAMQLKVKRTGTITNPGGGIRLHIYNDASGQVGSEVTGASPFTIFYSQITGSYVILGVGTGTQALVNGQTYWFAIQQTAAPIGGTIQYDSATTNNTNVSTSANGSSWAAAAAGPGLFYQLLARHGIGLLGQTTNNIGVQGTSTTSVGVGGTSTTNIGGSFTSTNYIGCRGVSTSGDAFVGTTTGGNGITLTTRDGIGASITQTGALVQNVTGAGLFVTRSQTLSGFTSTGPLLGGNTTVADTGNLLDLQKSGVSQFAISHDGHMILGGATPGISAVGGGAGSAPTSVGVVGNDTVGVISLTTAGSAPTANSTVATITFAVPYSTAPKSIALTPANGATAGLISLATPFVDSANLTTASFIITSGTTALGSGVAYKWYYRVGG